MQILSRVAIAACLLLTNACSAENPDWRKVAPENLLLIETTKGRLLIEMRPDLAPEAVARIRQLARDGVYDGLQFHRVIDGFVAQTGNPDNKDGGASSYPNLKPEFTARVKPDAGYVAVVTRSDGTAGFLGTLPVETVSALEDQRRAEGTTEMWGAYCPGVAGMGRGEALDSANSEIFFMRGAARRLDRLYTAWGMTIEGVDVLYKLNVGEPPAQPDVMTRVRVVADMPEDERPAVEAMRPSATDFLSFAGAIRGQKRADFSICDLKIGVEIKWPDAAGG
ncbi:MAG: peptidylprolyl isomerase [Alphaproteobacteria bacterium]|nr:peptidylprolyl isomerase [Alphaproteobacteria bacterium]